MADDNDVFIRFLRALGNNERIEVLKLLKENKEMCAQEIEKHFFLEQSTTSHHLNTLKNAGIVNTRKSGRNIYYTLNFPSLKDTCNKFLDIFAE